MDISHISHKITETTHHLIEGVKHPNDVASMIAHVFEETWGEFTHEHRVLHTGEMMFAKVMMLVWW